MTLYVNGVEVGGGGGAPSGPAGGDLAGTYPNPTIATGAVTLAKRANLATSRIIGRSTAGTGVPEALTGAQAQAILYPPTTVDLSSSSGWTTRNGEGGSGTAAVNTGTLSLDFTCTSAGSQTYASVGRAPWASPPLFDVRARISAFSSASANDGLLMYLGDALAASIVIGVEVNGADGAQAFSSSGSPAARVTVAGVGDGQGWLRFVAVAGLQVTAYVGIGAAGAEPTSWTNVGYVQLAAGGRVTWPFIVFQVSRNSGSGNVSATITSITYYSYP